MGKIFKRGLIALAPVAITLVIILWLLTTLEDIFSVPMKWVAGKYYFPGMGLIVAIVFIFFVGVIINNLLMQKLSKFFDRFFARIPLFKIIYNSIVDVMRYFRPKKEKKGQMVEIQIDSIRFFGILTREDFSEMPPGFSSEEDVTVFIPFSYQIGGFTILIPRSKIKYIDLTVEQGMRFIVTAGLVSGKNDSS